MEQDLEQQQSNVNILLDAQRSAHSSAIIGRETLEKLNEQEEDIQKIRDTLEANDYVLGKSLTALRSMTWGGYVYNSCVTITNTLKNAPSNLTAVDPRLMPRFSSSNSSDNNNTVEVAIDTNYSDNAYSNNQNGKQENLETAPSKSVYYNKNNEEEEKQLQDISSIVAQLHDISVTMGEQLDRQTKALETVEELTEKVTDKSLYVTLRATQLSTRVKGKNEQIFIGKFQFIDCVRGKFLSSVPDKATFFNCFASSDGVRNIFGIQNEKTLKFIGCTMWGTVRCAASYFGTQEECFMEFNGEETGLLLLARNWGSGGWLKYPAIQDENNDKNRSSSSFFDEQYHVMFSSTTSSIHDKQNIALFRAVPEELCVRMR
eukprot:gene26328-34958_t